MSQMRTEHDSLGEVQVPENALYGAQTQRAIENFPVSGRSMPRTFIQGLLLVKSAAARANVELGLLDADTGAAIEAVCRELGSDAALMEHFPVDVFQTGSGTSTNMNANEVLATLAGRRLGREVHPNDHVNCSQSSNDVIPTAMHVSAAMQLDNALLPALYELRDELDRRATELAGVVKTGRTHLMDAMPVRLDQTLGAWRDQVRNSAYRLKDARTALQEVPQGGTAVGTGVNAPEGFAAAFCNHLSALSGLVFSPAANAFVCMGAQETVVAASGDLKACAVALMKIANDLRWMNSGPLAGLAEIELEALQPGSSIMPAKVNPVIPESVAQVAAQVMGNDTAITVGGQSGNFELNVMLPMMADNLLQSIALLASAAGLLARRAIAGFRVNEANLQGPLARNPVLVTALNTRIGYSRAAEIAKKAYRENRPILDVAGEETDIPRQELAELLDPMRLTGD